MGMKVERKEKKRTPSKETPGSVVEIKRKSSGSQNNSVKHRSEEILVCRPGTGVSLTDFKKKRPSKLIQASLLSRAVLAGNKAMPMVFEGGSLIRNGLVSLPSIKSIWPTGGHEDM